jgi:hypothetical protein
MSSRSAIKFMQQIYSLLHLSQLPCFMNPTYHLGEYMYMDTLSPETLQRSRSSHNPDDLVRILCCLFHDISRCARLHRADATCLFSALWLYFLPGYKPVQPSRGNCHLWGMVWTDCLEWLKSDGMPRESCCIQPISFHEDKQILRSSSRYSDRQTTLLTKGRSACSS